ncbi:MAG: UvrD-helicase domain-containing protein [Planctomycetota bacterium]|nr:UvrD-helicase domain-containing protein [Planctomycetota bacterium]
MNALQADTDARALASREFARPLVVVAGAGTGKTTTLVGRVVTWLVVHGWSEFAAAGVADEAVAPRAVDAVLAITFTKAAAAEMDARVRSALRDLENGTRPVGVVLPDGAVSPDAVVRQRARALRLALDRALATTIHGFCQSLLAEHPTEARLAPGFAVDAESELVPEFARRAVEEDLAQAFVARGDEDWLRVARDGVGPDGIAACVASLRGEGVRAADLAVDPSSDAAIGEALADLGPRVEALCALALVPLGKARGSAVAGAVAGLAAIRALFARRDPADPCAFVRALAELDLADLRKKLGEWAEGEFGATGAAALGEDIGAAQAAARQLKAPLLSLSSFDVDGFRARRAIVRRVLARAEALGEEASVLTYGDLLTRAALLVEEDSALRNRLRRRYRQILVDEFQDTDSVQCRLVRALALGPARDRPGLFLVGDPKQSIYGWRGADLEAYDEFVDEVLASGGLRVELVKNFRSTPQILEAVERFVAPTMIAEHGVQPPFQPLHASAETPGPVPEIWIAWNVDPGAAKSFGSTLVDDSARREAARLARALREQHEAGTHWKDMAILVRARTRLDVALDALRAADIPFQVEGDRSYYQRREIVDGGALLGAIVDPGDTLSLLAHLRSSVSGLPDAVLEHLWERGLPQEAQILGGDPAEDARAIERVLGAARERARGLATTGWPGGRGLPEFPAGLGHALESLARLRRSLREDTADRFIERLRELVLLEPTEASRYHGHYRAANLERFFRRLGEDLEATGDAVSVLRALRRSLDEERQAKEARPRDEVEDAVRFLTIHAAKGLEFECVFLTGMASGSNQRGRSGDGFDRATGEQRLCGSKSPGWWRVEEAARAREGAERVRLLYVALTRAKRRLVLSGVWREVPVLRSATQSKSFCDLAEHGLPAEFGAEARRHVEAQRAAFECGGLSLVLATDDDVEAAARRETVPDPGLAARAVRDMQLLAPLAEAARERAARPRVATASASPVEPAATSTAARSGSGLTRDEARLVGTLVHAALELAPDFAAARARLASMAERIAADPGVRADAGSVLDLVEHGPLGQRLRALADSIVARELPLVLSASGSEGPTDAWTGSADLVHQDGDAWVVVDYKTEGLAGGRSSEAAEAHATQLGIYARALREALGLAEPVRREVWFLREGQRVELA